MDDSNELIKDILTSDDEEEEEDDDDNDDEEEEEEKPQRKTKLVPVGGISEVDQTAIRALPFSERAKQTMNSSSLHSYQKKETPVKKDRHQETNDDHRKNVRRAPRGRMNGRRNDA